MAPPANLTGVCWRTELGVAPCSGGQPWVSSASPGLARVLPGWPCQSTGPPSSSCNAPGEGKQDGETEAPLVPVAPLDLLSTWLCNTKLPPARLCSWHRRRAEPPRSSHPAAPSPVQHPSPASLQGLGALPGHDGLGAKTGFALRVQSSWLQINPTNRKAVQRERGSRGRAGSEGSKSEDKTVAVAAGQPIFQRLRLQ